MKRVRRSYEDHIGILWKSYGELMELLWGYMEDLWSLFGCFMNV